MVSKCIKSDAAHIKPFRARPPTRYTKPKSTSSRPPQGRRRELTRTITLSETLDKSLKQTQENQNMESQKTTSNQPSNQSQAEDQSKRPTKAPRALKHVCCDVNDLFPRSKMWDWRNRSKATYSKDARYATEPSAAARYSANVKRLNLIYTPGFGKVDPERETGRTFVLKKGLSRCASSLNWESSNCIVRARLMRI